MAVAETLGVARSNPIDRLQGRTRPRQGYRKAEDAELVPQIMALVTARPTYDYRRFTWLGMATSSVAPSSSTRMIARSSPGGRW